jgi:(p)ppGpp synthase/HD superfamily hydrolase
MEINEVKIEYATSDLAFVAYNFATIKHLGQKDDAGFDYFTAHCVPVANLIAAVAPDDRNLICAALLHDTLEDTDTTYENLLRTFGEDVANLVREVTCETDKEGRHHFPHLKTQRGIMLKFADRLSNVSRIGVWPQKRQIAYLKKSKFWLS